MRVQRYGERALLISEIEEDPAGLASWLRGRGVRCQDIVPGASTVVLDGCVLDPDRLLAILRDRIGQPADGALTAPVIELPVQVGGPDLSWAADQWGVPPEAVAEVLAGWQLRVAFCGFAPGFAYLSGMPPAYRLPRLPSPRPRVEVGAFAVADRWCGAYPSASPGGWRVIGRTGARLWDLERPDPVLLTPGARVRLVPQ